MHIDLIGVVLLDLGVQNGERTIAVGDERMKSVVVKSRCLIHKDLRNTPVIY